MFLSSKTSSWRSRTAFRPADYTWPATNHVATVCTSPSKCTSPENPACRAHPPRRSLGDRQLLPLRRFPCATRHVLPHALHLPVRGTSESFSSRSKRRRRWASAVERQEMNRRQIKKTKHRKHVKCQTGFARLWEEQPSLGLWHMPVLSPRPRGKHCFACHGSTRSALKHGEKGPIPVLPIVKLRIIALLLYSLRALSLYSSQSPSVLCKPPFSLTF